MIWKTVPLLSALAVSILASCGSAIADEKNPNNLVNPFIGTGGHGHTYPGASVPFGMVQLSPDTGTRGWDWCSGYNYSDQSIMGFSHTHLSGTGCGDLGDILFAPTVGPIEETLIDTPAGNAASKNSASSNADTADGKSTDKPPYSSRFLHANETASPGYYSVKLDRDGGILVELTATPRTGMHRYTFPTSDKANIIIDMTHGISDEPIDLQLNFVGNKKITGLRRSKGWAQDQYVYFVAEFSQPFSDFGSIVNDDKAPTHNREAQGKKLRGYVTFKARDKEPILARVALSTTSIDGAELNLQKEASTWKFDDVKQAAASQWNKELKKVTAESTEKKDLETFYTAVYHALLAPTIISDVDGKFRGSDHKVHENHQFATYSTFSLWDTFRAEHPFFTLAQPDIVDAFLSSILEQGKNSEKQTLAIWPLYGNETYCMIGYHSFPVIAEAYRKGFRNWDTKAMLSLMVENSKRNDWWSERGYIPADKEDQSVSKTLEFAYDDWTLAEFAKALGEGELAKKYLARSQAYKNVFDKQIGFVRGKMSDGTWRTPFNPANSKPGALHDFTEGNAWQYTFFVPQNIPGLIKELGGRAAFNSKLDELFTKTVTDEKDLVQDFTGVIGQYAHGNEPSHQIAYMYDYSGEPWKTQDRVRQIRDQYYTNARDGLCGNEDCGQMSAWYIFSALGFYPVNPVDGEYVIGSPAFPKATINLPGNKTFTISRDSNKKYIDKVRLNGNDLSRVYLTHKEITDGGRLEFIMADKPGTWGTAEQDAPH
jgi:predicted alpha-1,2-mannosidase